MTKRAQQDIARKLKVLNHAKETGNIAKTCRYFGICRQTFYTWEKSFEEQGEKGLIAAPALKIISCEFQKKLKKR